jgi:glycosyltransferase involved in cell wall biosynthesis
VLRIAVLIPCQNEETTIAKVVRDFSASLPQASIYVFDNNSSDRTRALAAAAGAEVRTESRQGKGHVVRRMFADIDADVYVLVDGDDTYDAAAAPAMIDRLVHDRLDLVNGARSSISEEAFRPGHRLGNRALTTMVRLIFGPHFIDMLSGYKVFSRRFVKTFPALSNGFELETELTVHALDLRMPSAEIIVPYRQRPRGSQSKLHTFRDGFRILIVIGKLIKHGRPLLFFTVLGTVIGALSLALGIPIIGEFFRTGLVPRLPTAVLSACLGLLATQLVIFGFLLESVTRVSREIKRLAYVGILPVPLAPTIIADESRKSSSHDLSPRAN